jgi:hypothetical protein
MAADWTITQQVQSTSLSPGGVFQDGMKISFMSTSGVPGSIFVPLAQYNPENVAELIQSRVDAINAVHNL